MRSYLLAGLLIGGTAQAAAVPVTAGAASSAYTSKVSLTAVRALRPGVTVGATTNAVGGATPGTYAVASGLAVNERFTLYDGLLTDTVQTLGAKLASTSASYTFADVQRATASSLLGDVGLSLGTVTLGRLLASIGLNAKAIGSTTIVTADKGRLGGTGTTILTGLTLSGGVFGASLGGIVGGIDLYANAAANTRVPTLAKVSGVSVLLNEQIEKWTDARQLMRETNAVHITLKDHLLDGNLVSGEIVLGHSQAMLAVPEAATWGMMVLGFGAVGTALRRRRHPAPARATA